MCVLFCSFSSSGRISLEEFIEGANKDPWVMEQLKLDIGPCDWFMEKQERKTWTSFFFFTDSDD